MSYTPTNWQTGDIITAEKLNNMENGIASSIFYLQTGQLQSALLDGTDALWIVTEDGNEECENAFFVDNLSTSPTLLAMIYEEDGRYDCSLVNGLWLHTRAVSEDELASIQNTYTVVMEPVWCFIPNSGSAALIPTGTSVSQGTGDVPQGQ